MHGSLGTEQDVPGHLVCLLYSALVCPFWRAPAARFGKDSDYHGDGKRGSGPSIMGFWDYGVLVDPGVLTGDLGGRNPFALLYRDFEREIVFRNPLADLPQRYDEDRKRCGGRYVANKRRHYARSSGGIRGWTRKHGRS